MTKLKEMRMKRGYTQALFALECDVPLRQIKHLEQTGANMAAAQTVRIFARKLHCLMEDLLEDEDFPAQRRGRKPGAKNDDSESPQED